MIRPCTTSLASSPIQTPDVKSALAKAPPWQDIIAPIVEALAAVVAAVESQPADGPAWKAFQSAIRQKGEEAAAAGGSEAMEVVLRAVADAALDRSDRRETIITAAWVGLKGWRK